MRRLVASLAALALSAVGVNADADSPYAPGEFSATYMGSEACGVVTVSGNPGMGIVVRAEQPSGNYAIVYSGLLSGSGTAMVPVAPNGIVGNGQPMFFVTFFTSPGTQHVAVIGGGPEPEDGHWLW